MKTTTKSVRDRSTIIFQTTRFGCTYKVYPVMIDGIERYGIEWWRDGVMTMSAEPYGTLDEAKRKISTGLRAARAGKGVKYYK